MKDMHDEALLVNPHGFTPVQLEAWADCLDWLQNDSEGYNYACWPCCIGGGLETMLGMSARDCAKGPQEVMRRMGMTPEDGMALFFNDKLPGSCEDADLAARVVERYAFGDGVIDWLAAAA